MRAAFQARSTTNVMVNGTTTAPDSLLVSAAAELKLQKGLSVGLKFDSEYAATVQTYAGTGTLRYS